MRANKHIRIGAKAQLKPANKLPNDYLGGNAEKYGEKIFTIYHIEWMDEDNHFEGIDHVRFEEEETRDFEWRIKDIEKIIKPSNK